MATIIENEFTQYSQSEQETLAGCTFTIDQLQFLQSQIAMIAQSRIALVPDPNNYAEFIQKEANYKGQMDAYKYLLDCHVSSQEQLLALAKAQNETSRTYTYIIK